MVTQDDLKVLALRADAEACGRYRIEYPAAAARAHGVDITVDHDLPADVIINKDGTTEILSLALDQDVNVIIFQRPLIRAFADAIEMAQSQGIACIVELDDDLSTVDRDNQAYWSVHPKASPHANYEHLLKAAHTADWVIASTPEIARKFAPHGRASVIRNVLPEWVFDIEKEFSDDIRLGWSGSLATHPHDLPVVGKQIATALRNTNVSFSVLGDATGVQEQLYLTDDIKFHNTPWVPLDDYHTALAFHIDVGIVPLDNIPFNRAKSYLKGLEMAGVGIPFVASPTDEYVWLSEHGAGLIARKPRDWQKHVRRLVTNRDYLLEQSASMRDAVRPFTYENYVGHWIEAWQSALEYRERIMH